MSGWAWFSEELLAFPAAGEFSLSAASAFLPVSLGPFLMSPKEPFASVQNFTAVLLRIRVHGANPSIRVICFY